MRDYSFVTAVKQASVVFASLLASPALSFTLDCTSGSGSYNGTSSEIGTVILPAGGTVTLMQSNASSFTMRLDGRTFDAGGNQSGTALACQNSAGGIFEVPLYARSERLLELVFFTR